MGSKFLKLSNVPRVVHAPQDCFLAPFLCFQVSCVGVPPTASSSATLIFVSNCDIKVLHVSFIFANDELSSEKQSW